VARSVGRLDCGLSWSHDLIAPFRRGGPNLGEQVAYLSAEERRRTIIDAAIEVIV